MKFITVYYTHKPGGLCQRFYRCMTALVQGGHSVFYLTLDEPPKELSSSVKCVRIPFPLKARSGLGFWVLFSAWFPVFFLASLIRLKPDRVFVFNTYYAVFLLPISTLFGKKMLIFVRGLQARLAWPWSSLFRALESMTLRNAAGVVCVSENTLQRLALENGVSGARLKLLPNSLPQVEQSVVDQRPWLKGSILGLPAERPVPLILVCAGVLQTGKNQTFLLNAWAASRLPSQGAILLFAGDGPSRPELEQSISQSRIEGVYLLGWRSDLARILEAADVLIHPSLHEGMPNVVLEALAHKKITLCSDIGPHREILFHDELLFPLEKVEVLTKKLNALLQLEVREQLSSLCRQRAQKYSFDWDSRVREILEN